MGNGKQLAVNCQTVRLSHWNRILQRGESAPWVTLNSESFKRSSEPALHGYPDIALFSDQWHGMGTQQAVKRIKTTKPKISCVCYCRQLTFATERICLVINCLSLFQSNIIFFQMVSSALKIPKLLIFKNRKCKFLSNLKTTHFKSMQLKFSPYTQGQLKASQKHMQNWFYHTRTHNKETAVVAKCIPWAHLSWADIALHCPNSTEILPTRGKECKGSGSLQSYFSAGFSQSAWTGF